MPLFTYDSRENNIKIIELIIFLSLYPYERDEFIEPTPQDSVSILARDLFDGRPSLEGLALSHPTPTGQAQYVVAANKEVTKQLVCHH